MKFLSAQPKAFYLIFILEIWERFGYYALSAMAILFMVQGMGMTDADASYLYARFIALVYLLPSIGGYIGDRVLGTKRTMVLGQIILLIGYVLLCIPTVTAYSFALPLAVVAVGAGYFKPNPSSLLSKVYEKTGYHKDSGFTLFYMAINIGSLLSIIVTPLLSRKYGWHIGFSISAAGLVLANIIYCVMKKRVTAYGSAPDFLPISMRTASGLFLGTWVTVALCWGLLVSHDLINWLLFISMVILFGFFIYQIKIANPRERKGMIFFLILFFQGIVFFVLFFQTAMSLNLFALRNVSHELAGIPIHPAQFQALNGLWIFIMSPFLAALYQWLKTIHKDPGLAAKFALGIGLIGVAFLVMPLAGLCAHQGLISGWWMVLVYGLISMGELLVSALGLSLVARYIPSHLVGYAMGLWFLCLSIAGMLAGHVAAMANIPKTVVTDPLVSLVIYNHVFLWLGLVAMGIAIILWVSVPYLNRLADGK